MQAKKYEEGLHNLNGILTFTDYATLATGLGSLLSKGASMAGRYAGKQMAKRAVGSNGTKRLLLQNTASTFDQSNKILDLPDYSRQVIKINT